MQQHSQLHLIKCLSDWCFISIKRVLSLLVALHIKHSCPLANEFCQLGTSSPSLILLQRSIPPEILNNIWWLIMLSIARIHEYMDFTHTTYIHTYTLFLSHHLPHPPPTHSFIPPGWEIVGELSSQSYLRVINHTYPRSSDNRHRLHPSIPHRWQKGQRRYALITIAKNLGSLISPVLMSSSGTGPGVPPLLLSLPLLFFPGIHFWLQQATGRARESERGESERLVGAGHAHATSRRATETNPNTINTYRSVLNISSWTEKSEMGTVVLPQPQVRGDCVCRLASVVLILPEFVQYIGLAEVHALDLPYLPGGCSVPCMLETRTAGRPTRN